jgi:hypothetical protein
MKLQKGQRYNIEHLKFLGWSDGTDGDTDGYAFDSYFAADGKYLGPDDYGVEPIVEESC